MLTGERGSTIVVLPSLRHATDPVTCDKLATMPTVAFVRFCELLCRMEQSLPTINALLAQ
jgi:hypothetical protein